MSSAAPAYATTPEGLFHAIRGKNKYAVREILRLHPELAKANWQNRSMLMHAVQEAAPDTMSDKESFQAQHLRIEGILKLLLLNGADPHERTPGPHPETLLHLAARTGAKSAVDLLLRRSVDLQTQGGGKSTPPLVLAIDALVHLPCVVKDELKRPGSDKGTPATPNTIEEAWNAQAKSRNIVRSYLDCIESLIRYHPSSGRDTVQQRLSAPVHGVPDGAEVNMNALWLLLCSCDKSFWLNKERWEETKELQPLLSSLAHHLNVDSRLTLATDPATPVGDSMLQHALRTGLGEGGFYTLLWNGADQSVAHPLHPEYSVRDYYRLYAAGDDELKKTYDKMLTWDRGSFQLGSNGIWDTLLHYGNKGSYTDLPNQTKRLAEFGGLHRVFESPITEYFKREEECLQVAQLLEALLPAHLKGATGPYTMRQAPLAQPETSATVAYLRGATAEVKR